MRHAEPCGSIQPILTKIFENKFTLKPCPKNIKFVTIREHGTSTYNTKFKEYNLSQSINPVQYLQSWKYFGRIWLLPRGYFKSHMHNVAVQTIFHPPKVAYVI